MRCFRVPLRFSVANRVIFLARKKDVVILVFVFFLGKAPIDFGFQTFLSAAHMLRESRVCLSHIQATQDGGFCASDISTSGIRPHLQKGNKKRSGVLSS